MKIIYKPCPNQCFSAENGGWLPLGRTVIAIRLTPCDSNWAYSLMNSLSGNSLPHSGKTGRGNSSAPWALGLMFPLVELCPFVLGSEV